MIKTAPPIQKAYDGLEKTSRLVVDTMIAVLHEKEQEVQRLVKKWDKRDER